MRYKNIIFDCDSTLVKIEGLDEIAKRKGIDDEVSRITATGMNGNLPFSQSLRARLAILEPTEDDLVWLGRQYVRELIPDAVVVVNELKAHGLNIFILTGGLYSAVRVLARYLKIGDGSLWAVKLKGFDPLIGSDPIGMNNLDTFKIKFVQKIQKTGPAVLIGDGMTDYEAGKFADLFIGFGGVVLRPKLKRLCRFYVEEPRLQPVLDIVL